MTRAVDIEGRGVRMGSRSVGVGSAIPDSAIHYFENNSTTVSNNNWTGWGDPTESLSVQETTVLAGDYSGQIVGGGSNDITATRDSDHQPSEISCSVQADAQTGNDDEGIEIWIQNTAGTRIHLIRFDGTGTLRSFTSSIGTASWSVDTTYLARWYNIDYANDEFDFECVRVSDDTQILNTTSVAFENDVSFGQIQVVNKDNAGSATDPNVFVDNVDNK